jgi:hypothetical protein
MLKTIWIDDEPYQFDTDELVELGHLYVCINCYRYLFKTESGSYIVRVVDGSMVPEHPSETWRILTAEQALRFMSPSSSVELTEAGEKELASLLERFAVRL